MLQDVRHIVVFFAAGVVLLSAASLWANEQPAYADAGLRPEEYNRYVNVNISLQVPDLKHVKQRWDEQLKALEKIAVEADMEAPFVQYQNYGVDNMSQEEGWMLHGSVTYRMNDIGQAEAFTTLLQANNYAAVQGPREEICSH